MAWEIQWQLGVMSDDRGRRYRIARNSRGKEDKVYVKENGAEPGYSIPIPTERKKELPAKWKRKGSVIDASTGKPVVHMPRRMMVIRYRMNGEKEVGTLTQPNGEGQRMVDEGIRSLLRSPDCGKTWIPVIRNEYDYFMQSHKDAEEPQ